MSESEDARPGTSGPAPHGRPHHGPATGPAPSPTVPPPRPARPRPGPPPELDHTGRRHRRAMEGLTLLGVARRIPTASAQTARPAWSVDRCMVITVPACQLLPGLGTAVVPTAVAQALPHLLTAASPAAALEAATPGGRHRLDNVRRADRVVVLDRGRIREEGTCDEPVTREGSPLGELYALSRGR
ncbi:hypothetical protein ACIP93_27185 [Streptomyces sp. NPDC088745]|uniref:hypothetical protein n=1 Tax=Streptomyces sp. NPDC088745 TaxID=3365884 RepID=UPI0037F347EC